MTSQRASSPRAIPFALLALLVVGLGLGAGLGLAAAPSGVPGTALVGGDTVPTVAALGPTSFVDPGPFAAGETTLTLPSDGAPVEVWYPATLASVQGHAVDRYDLEQWLPAQLRAKLPPGFSVTHATGAYRGVPVAAGRFPLVLFSHGFAGYRDQSTFLTSRLATWGFVVAAPDHVGRDLTSVLGALDGVPGYSLEAHDVEDLEATITLLAAQDQSPGSPLAGHVDLTRIAAVGHSAGGEAAEEVAAADPRVRTFVGLAGSSVGAFGTTVGGAGASVPDKPGMLMVGTDDHVADPSAIASAFVRMDPPKRLITLTGAGHLAFSDICVLARGQGGLLGVAAKVGITVPPLLQPLATDGCGVPLSRIEADWAVIRQAVTAQLRHVFGFDPGAAGLTGLTQAFPGDVSRNVSVGTGP